MFNYVQYEIKDIIIIIRNNNNVIIIIRNNNNFIINTYFWAILFIYSFIRLNVFMAIIIFNF